MLNRDMVGLVPAFITVALAVMVALFIVLVGGAR